MNAEGLSRVPLPHILEQKNCGINRQHMRFVSDQDLDKGKYLVANNGIFVRTAFDVYEVTEVEEKRPARGDWSAWPDHPTYYEAIVRPVGTKNEDEVKEFLAG